MQQASGDKLSHSIGVAVAVKSSDDREVGVFVARGSGS